MDSIKKISNGNPYKNYINLNRGTYLDFDDKRIFIPGEKQFSLNVPNNMITPGLEIEEGDDNSLRYEGMIHFKDILNQNLICNWERINLALELNNQSTYTPLNEVLKGTVFRHIENLKNRVDEIHIQRLEYISKEYKLLDSIKNNDEKEIENLICCVTKIPSTKNLWRGDLFFFKYPYVIHLMIDYPFSKLNENEKEKIISKFSNEKVKIKIKDILKNDNLMNDSKDISLKLRNDLIEIYKKSF
eukprot:gene8870-819_t